MKNKDLDNFFKSKSNSFNEMPSDDLWKKIQNNLPQEPQPKLNFKKTFFMTFTIIALFSVTSLILNINDNPEKIDKTDLNHDSLKKEKLLIVLDTNVQLKSSPNRLGLKTIIPANKTPNNKTTSKNNALTPKISVKTSKTDVNNLQSIIKKDLKTQDVYSESLKNDTLNNTNELIIETIGSNTQIISKNVIQISEISNFQEKIYPMDDVDVKPEFSGRITKLYEFIGKNYKTPKDCSGGRIRVTFVIEKDGSLTDIKTVKDIGFGVGDEAVRVLRESPKWKPGKHDGKIVRVLYQLQITVKAAGK